jgi:predicted DNA-binding protein
MKGNLPVVGCRIPHTLNDKLEQLCQATGDTPSKVLRDALSAYLGANTPESVESIHKRVAGLERQINKLMKMQMV